MKKIFFIALSLFVVSATACKKDEGVLGEVDLGYVKILSSDVNFDYNGGIGTIVVDTESTVEYTLESSGKSWCDVSVEGNTISVSVPLYVGMSSRNTYVEISAGDREPVKINISQTSTVFGIIGVDALTLTLNCLATGSPAAGIRTFEYSPKGVIGIEATSETDWIASVTVNDAAGTITVNAEDNNTDAERVGEIKFSSPDREITYTVVQEARDIVINGTDLTVDNTTGDIILKFGRTAGSSTIAYGYPGGVAVSATTGNTWISLSNDNETGILTVNVPALTGVSRNGVITFDAGGVTKQVKVFQTR